MKRVLSVVIATVLVVAACGGPATTSPPAPSGASPAIPSSPSPGTTATPAASGGLDTPISGIELAMAEVPRAAAEPGAARRVAESVNAFGLLRLVDYVADPEAARKAINAWVSRETMDRIPELLEPPNVTQATRLCLVNAVYLKAEWERWFDLDGTAPAPFTRLDGSSVDVPMMTRWAGGLGSIVPYARGDGWNAVELRYAAAPGTPRLAMTVILPEDLPAFEAALDGAMLSAIVDELDAERASFEVNQCPDQPDAGCYPYDIELFMPRFSIESRADLGETLAAAGMPLAFDAQAADFSGINAAERAFIRTVIHQANVDVDEKGTEAAAATAVGMDTGGGPSAMERFTVRLDRPFLFLLRDVETGAVLFLGRVVDPSHTR